MPLSNKKFKKKNETENTALKSKLNELESRSMRENLLFYGIEEPEETEEEDCEELVKRFITEKLKINSDAIMLDR